MPAQPRVPSDSALRRGLLASWEEGGRPPCPLCGTPIAEGEKRQVSLVFGAVVHRLCASFPAHRSAHDPRQCPEYEHIPAPRHPELCRCPRLGVVNMIVWARRNGVATVSVATHLSPGAERAAREAGLGQNYTDTPLRESTHLANHLHEGVIVNEALLNMPSSWHGPPETITIDVDRSIRDGRISAYMPPEPFK
jgi:hypothetical protein